MRKFLGLGMVALALLGFSQGAPEELLVRADALYNRWQGVFGFSAYEGRLREAIRLWEEALPALLDAGKRREVWVKLSRAYFELAEGYLVEKAEKERAYGKGKEYALFALRLDPEFLEAEKREGFRAAFRKGKDVEALFWYGNNLGRWLSYHYWEALVGGTRDVLAAFERCVELDEKYWGAGPRRALANFLAQTPGFLGGDFGRAKEEFARAVELAPEFLQNYVDYAEHWAKRAGEEELFCELLRKALALAQDPAVLFAWPFYNHLALERAKVLVRGCL